MDILYKGDRYVKERFIRKEFETVETTGFGNFDGLFGFLRETGFFSLFEFRPNCRKRVMIPLVYLFSTYSLKVIKRINSLNQIDNFLFKDRAILEMIGFNGVHFEIGFSRRNKGKHLPFNVSTLGKLIGDFSPDQTNELFSKTILLLGKKGFIKEGVFAVDATPLYVCYSSTDYENTGEIIKDRKKKKGYKLITLRYVGSLKEKEEGVGVFISGIVVPVNENESKYLIRLIERGIKNIGKEKIKMIVADRGFLSGKNLWEIKDRFGIDFLIYSKSNMDITKCELQVKIDPFLQLNFDPPFNNIFLFSINS